MVAIEHGGPAFPGSKQNEVMDGMSLRDYFAAMFATTTWAAVRADMRERQYQFEKEASTYGIAASAAYEFADAMLKARQA